jgi:GNAT superfamily N-acetyltransferase
VNVLPEPNPKAKRELQDRSASAMVWQSADQCQVCSAGGDSRRLHRRDWGHSVRPAPAYCKYHSPLSAEVYWMGVDPACHRRGIGRALMEAAVEDARKRGVRYLFVIVFSPEPDFGYESTPALRLAPSFPFRSGSGTDERTGRATGASRYCFTLTFGPATTSPDSTHTK